MGRGGTPARKINFVSLLAYGPKVFLLSLNHGGLQLLKPSRAVPNTRPQAAAQMSSRPLTLGSKYSCYWAIYPSLP